MLILDKLYRFLRIKNNQSYDTETINKLILLNFFTIIGGALALIFGIVQYSKANYPLSALLLVIALSMAFGVFHSRKTKNVKLISSIAVGASALLQLYLLFTGGENNTALIWLVAYPVFSILFFGKHIGLRFTLILFVTAIIFFIVPIPEEYTFFTTYPAELKIRFLVVYFSVTLFLTFHEHIKESILYKKEKELIGTQKRLKEKDIFISRLSFQMRTPLTNIVGVLNLDKETPNAIKTLEEIKMPINNIITIVNSIPEFSAAKINQIKQRNVNFDVRIAVRNTVKLYRNGNYSDLRFNITFSEDLRARVYGDLLSSKQIYISIIDFIYKYKPKKNIIVDFFLSQQFQSPPTVAYEISGEILPEYAEEFSDKNEKKPHEILMIKDMIKAQNGYFSYKIEDNIIKFRFSISYKPTPVVTKDIEEKRPAETGEPKIVSEAKFEDNVRLKNAKVLLVEDDKVNQKIMILSLKKYVKSIELAENGKQALDKFTTSKYDIILMDIRMPVMDGIKAAEKIRKTEEGGKSRVPIIAVTANAFAGDKDKCLAAGMDNYVSKPFQINELIKTMKKYLA